MQAQALKLTLSLVPGIRLRHGAPLQSRAEPSHTVVAPVGGPDHIAALAGAALVGVPRNYAPKIASLREGFPSKSPSLDPW